MIISVNQTPEREAAVKAALPSAPTGTPIFKLAQDALDAIREETEAALEREIEIYRNFPKDNGSFDGDAFDPTNSEVCFMGQAFFTNGQNTDSELKKLREAMGVFPHPTWGTCTLLELWAAAHWSKGHKDVVKAAFLYGAGISDVKPKVECLVNIFFLDPIAEEAVNGWERELLNIKATAFDMKIAEDKVDEFIEVQRVAWEEEHGEGSTDR